MSEPELTKGQKLARVANQYRGVYIGTFIQMEHIMADISITVDYNSDFGKYFKHHKMSSVIVADFWTAFEKIKHLAPPEFLAELPGIKSNTDLLVKYRNIFAHWMLFSETSYIEKFDGDTVHLIQYNKGQSFMEAIDFNRVRALCRSVENTATALIVIQQALYRSLGKPHPMDQ